MCARERGGKKERKKTEGDFSGGRTYGTSPTKPQKALCRLNYLITSALEVSHYKPMRVQS